MLSVVAQVNIYGHHRELVRERPETFDPGLNPTSPYCHLSWQIQGSYFFVTITLPLCI
jgi:hypothetical protein